MRKRGDKYANGAFAARCLSPRRHRFPCCPLTMPGTFGADSPLPLLVGKRPAMQKPFVSDRSKAERLLHSLDLDARQIAPYLIKKLPLSRSRTLLDIGGGLGTFSVAFCRHYPRLRATLVEHPRVLPLARRAVGEAGMARQSARSSERIFHAMLCRRDSIPYLSPMFCTPTVSLKTNPYCLSSSAV